MHWKTKTKHWNVGDKNEMELKRYDEMESKTVIFSLQLKVSREYECIFHAFRVLVDGQFLRVRIVSGCYIV